MKLRTTAIFILLTIFNSFAQLNRINVTKFENYSNSEKAEEVEDTVRFNLLNINYKDTLIFFSTIKECGEYGGHIEWIKIFRSKNNLRAQHFSEPLCNLEKLGFKEKISKNKFARKEKYTMNKAVKLDETRIELITEYISKFNNFKRNGTRMSNAPNDFWITFNGKTLAKRHDKIGNWDGFIVLRNKLYD
jgi:hypothetical protein